METCTDGRRLSQIQNKVVKSTSSVDSSNASLESEKQNNVTDDESCDTFETHEEDKIRNRFKLVKYKRPSFEDLHGDDGTRRPSITMYQSIDDDHPDLASIQNIVANMTFGEDLD